MNELSIKNIKDEYNDFREKMISSIKNPKISNFIYPFEECYLIDETFIKELEYYLSRNLFPNTEPIIINDFNSAINYLTKSKTISLINKRIIEIIGYRNILMNCKTVLCYGGNNKLIIEFKDGRDNKSFLIISPSNENKISRYIFIITNNKIQSLYESIFNNTYNQFKTKKIIVPFEEYQNNNKNPANINSYNPTPTPNYNQGYNPYVNNNNINQNRQLPVRENLLSIFIYIFYYEKYLHENNNGINLFNNNEKYCLINPEWLQKFKEYYNYRNLSYSLKNNNKYNSLNYNNLDENKINDIINDYYLNENILNFQKAKLSPYLKEISHANCILNNNFKSFNNTLFILEGIIIPDKIMKLIKTLDTNLSSIKPKNIIFKQNMIIYIIYKKIIISNLNYNLFNPKFVFILNSKELVQNEIKKILNSNSVIEYIKFMNCNENEKDILQSLRNEKGEEIGKLIIINKESKIQKKSTYNNQMKTTSAPKGIITPSGNEKIYNLTKSQESLSNGGNFGINKPKVLISNSLEKKEHITSQSQNIPSSSLNQSNNPNQIGISQLIINQNQSQNPQNQQTILRGRKKEGNSNNQQQLLNEMNKLKKDNDYLQGELKKSMIELEKKKIIIEKLQNKYNEIMNIYERLKYDLNESQKEISFLRSKSADILQKEQIIKKRENILKQREYAVSKKEKELNEKINFLEDKENIIEKENQEIDSKRKEFQKDYEIKKKLKQEINNLIIQRNYLINEIKKCQEEHKKLMSQIQSIENKHKLINNMNQNNKVNENKNNNKNINKKVQPIKTYKIPPLIGLNNIGSTCYKNSVLQCLSQTASLTNFFLRDTSKKRIFNNNVALKNKNQIQLCPAYYNLIQNLWAKNGSKSFSPNAFMNVIENMTKNNPLSFKANEAGDAKDFIIFILEELHKELKKSMKSNNNQQEIPFNQYDRKSTLNHFIEEFKESCSIISDEFFGFNETNTICMYCKKNYNSRGLHNPICYNFGIFNCLIFPLEEVKNMKNNSMKNNYIQINNNRVSIYECFYYNQKTDYFTGENRNYCNICKQLSDAIYTSKIFVSPNILVMILNRGKGNIYNVKLDFTEYIDITQFVQQRDCPQLIYSLYGVITHIGESGPNAHFVASCKSPVDNKLYRYNDAIVNPINNLQKEVIDFGTPYILFYKKNY